MSLDGAHREYEEKESLNRNVEVVCTQPSTANSSLQEREGIVLNKREKGGRKRVGRICAALCCCLKCRCCSMKNKRVGTNIEKENGDETRD